jgi:hypothetical protein
VGGGTVGFSDIAPTIVDNSDPIVEFTALGHTLQSTVGNAYFVKRGRGVKNNSHPVENSLDLVTANGSRFESSSIPWNGTDMTIMFEAMCPNHSGENSADAAVMTLGANEMHVYFDASCNMTIGYSDEIIITSSNSTCESTCLYKAYWITIDSAGGVSLYSNVSGENALEGSNSTTIDLSNNNNLTIFKAGSIAQKAGTKVRNIKVWNKVLGLSDLEIFVNLKSVTLDGSSKYFTGNIPTNFDLQSVTISMWVFNKSGVSSYKCLFQFGHDNTDLRMFRLVNEKLQMYANRADQQNVLDSVSATVSTVLYDTWTHVAVTINDTEKTITYYSNGQFISTHPYSIDANLPARQNETVAIGVYAQVGTPVNGWYLHGAVDEVGLYSRVLTATEVAALYNGGVPPNLSNLTSSYGSIVAWWSFDGDASDRSGNNNHLMSYGIGAGDYTTDVPSYASKSVNIIGTNEKYLSRPSIPVHNNFTMSFWFKLNASIESNSAILFSFGSENAPRAPFMINSSYKFYNNPRNLNIENSEHSYLSTTSISRNIWYHVTYVWDSDQFSFYVNGILEGTKTWYALSMGTSSMFIGHNYNTMQNYAHLPNSFMKNMVYYNKALNATEVEELYNDGYVVDPTTLVSSKNNISAWWPLNGDYLDRSGNGYHLTALGAPAFSLDVPVPESRSMYLDGSTTFSRSTDVANIPVQSWTVSAWVKPQEGYNSVGVTSFGTSTLIETLTGDPIWYYGNVTVTQDGHYVCWVTANSTTNSLKIKNLLTDTTRTITGFNKIEISKDGSTLILGNGMTHNVFKKTSEQDWANAASTPLTSPILTDNNGWGVPQVCDDGSVVVFGGLNTPISVRIYEWNGSSYTLVRTYTGSSRYGQFFTISPTGDSLGVSDHENKRYHMYRRSPGGSWGGTVNATTKSSTEMKENVFAFNYDGTVMCTINNNDINTLEISRYAGGNTWTEEYTFGDFYYSGTGTPNMVFLDDNTLIYLDSTYRFRMLTYNGSTWATNVSPSSDAAGTVIYSVSFDQSMGDLYYLGTSELRKISIEGIGGFMNVTTWADNSEGMRINNTLRVEDAAGALSAEPRNSIYPSIWSHILITYDHLTEVVSSYINGVLDASATYMQPVHGTPSPLVVGQNFAGGLDEVSVWGTHFTPSQVKELYNNVAYIAATQHTNASSLQAYYNFDKDFLDRSGNGYHLTATGSPTLSTDVPAPVRRSVEFTKEMTNQNTSFPITEEIPNNSPVTMSAWVYIPSPIDVVDPGYIGLLSISGQGIEFRLLNYGTLGSGSGWTFNTNYKYSTVVIGSDDADITNKWMHLCYVNTGTHWRYYLNGMQIGDEVEGSINRGNYNATTIEVAPGRNKFDGKMTEVSLWNVALTPNQIEKLYNNGYSKDAVELQTEESLTDNLRAYYKFDGDFLDRSGNGYHLTAVGSPTFSYSVPNIEPKAHVNFDGNDGVYGTVTPFSARSASYSGWIRYTSITNNNLQRIFETQDPNNATYHYHTGIGLYQQLKTFQVHGIGSTTESWTPSLNRWYHFAWTYDDASTTHRFYLDGVLIITYVAAYNANAQGARETQTDIGIGCNWNGSDYYTNGRFSDVSMYSRALLQNEIVQLLQQSVVPTEIDDVVAWYKLESDANDYSGNERHLTGVAGNPEFQTFSLNIPGGDNLVRAWNFSSNSLAPYIGSTVMSFVSSTGDYSNQGEFLTDEKGSYFNFNNNISGYLRATIGLQPYMRENGKEFTFSMWYLLTSPHDGRANHFRIQNSDEIEGLYSYGANDNRVRYFSNRVHAGPYGNKGPTPNIWSHFMVVVKSNSEHKMYVNGDLISWTLTSHGGTQPPNSFLMDGKTLDKIDVGKMSEIGDHAVRDIRVYNRALSATEVTAIYDNGNGYI